jgi:hypothetical protein
VLTLAPGHHDAQDEDDQQEDGTSHQQWQQRYALFRRLQRLPCWEEAGGGASAVGGASTKGWGCNHPTPRGPHLAHPAVGRGNRGVPPLTRLPGSQPHSGHRGSSGHSPETAGRAGCQSPASLQSCGDRRKGPGDRRKGPED